jgi:hypothetical protein
MLRLVVPRRRRAPAVTAATAPAHRCQRPANAAHSPCRGAAYAGTGDDDVVGQPRALRQNRVGAL